MDQGMKLIIKKNLKDIMLLIIATYDLSIYIQIYMNFFNINLESMIKFNKFRFS
jgi:hypothetical protein